MKTYWHVIILALIDDPSERNKDGFGLETDHKVHIPSLLFYCFGNRNTYTYTHRYSECEQRCMMLALWMCGNGKRPTLSDSFLDKSAYDDLVWVHLGKFWQHNPNRCMLYIAQNWQQEKPCSVCVCVCQFQKPSGLPKAELMALGYSPARCKAWQWCWVQCGITALRALLCTLPAQGNGWGAAELQGHQKYHLGTPACHNTEWKWAGNFRIQEPGKTQCTLILYRRQNKKSFSNKAKLIEFWWKCFPKPILPSMAISRGNSCMLLPFAQCWLGCPSNSFPHSPLSSTGDKHQWQPTNQGGRSEGDQQDTTGLHYYANPVIQLNIG